MAKKINRFRHFSQEVNELLLTYHEDEIRETSVCLIFEIAGGKDFKMISAQRSSSKCKN